MNKIELKANEIIVFHGSNTPFDHFDDDKINQANGDSIIGHWFVDDLQEAVRFCKSSEGTVKVVALTLLNPSHGLDGDNFGCGQDVNAGRKFREDAISVGADGAVYEYGDFTYYAAFYGTQARVVAELSPQQAMYVHELIEAARWPKSVELIELFNQNIDSINDFGNSDVNVSIMGGP